MIYITKVENSYIILKLIDNANLYSFSVKIKIDSESTHIFRELYLNVQKGTPYLNYIDSVTIEYKENQIKFEGKNFEYKINTNLMIYSFDIDSPRGKIDKF
jgi:hypothetical protein